MIRLDRTGPMQEAPSPSRSLLPHVLLAALAVLPLAGVVLLAYRVRGGLPVFDLVASVLLVGTCSAYSAVSVAHELIHRRWRGARLGGRILLWSALYDHFYIEHLRGHHRMVGTAEDPTTARFGESFWGYARRSSVGQLVSAWRLGPAQVAAGLLAEVAILVAVLASFGAAALAAFLAQAIWASLLVAAVNYFDHWGLQRTQKKVREVDAWDCDSVLTHYSLLALSHHPDHHVRASRPFHELRATADSPRLPHGYLRMALLVVFRNAEAQRLMTAELLRKRLGPYSLAG
jgi:alkane 1-monooxygenase